GQPEGAAYPGVPAPSAGADQAVARGVPGRPGASGRCPRGDDPEGRSARRRTVGVAPRLLSSGRSRWSSGLANRPHRDLGRVSVWTPTTARRGTMPVRTASAVWNGALTDGNGTMTLDSGAYTGPYSFGSRFEEEPGSNPEELIAAAHAGCF